MQIAFLSGLQLSVEGLLGSIYDGAVMISERPLYCKCTVIRNYTFITCQILFFKFSSSNVDISVKSPHVTSQNESTILVQLSPFNQLI